MYLRLLPKYAAGLTIVFIVLIFPVSAHAATANFFGPIVPDACNCSSTSGGPATAPSTGCVYAVVQNVVNLGISLGCIFATLALVYAGFIWMFNGSNAEARSKGRNMFINVMIGLAIVLSAWLVVDYIMKKLYDANAPDGAGGTFGPWNSIIAGNTGDMCIQIRQTQQIPGLLGGIANGIIGNTNAGSATGNGGTSGAYPAGPTVGTDHLNTNSATANIDANASGSAGGACLHNVRAALAAGGVNLSCPHNGNAALQYAGDCNGPLSSLGFSSLGASDSTPRPGDIIVVSPVGSHTIGHIAMFDGNHWVSDFVQSNSERPPGCPYSDTGCPSVTYWRP